MKTGRYGQRYDPNKPKKDEIRFLAREAMVKQRWVTTANPVMVELSFRGCRANADEDNLKKLIYDALTDIVWKDDRQVMDSHTIKLPDSELEGTIIHVYEMKGDINDRRK